MVVLDAGVAGKWSLPALHEPFRPQAFELLKQYDAGELEFIVPDIFWLELGNILSKAVRQQRFPRKTAEVAISYALKQSIQTIASADLLPEALAIALDFDRTVYDSLYVALAKAAECDLITADERLANALAARFPIKWLGAM